MVIQPIAGFNGFHTLESVLALVGSSLLLKGLEKCGEKYCANTEINDIIHEVEQQVDHDLHYDPNADRHSETTTVMLSPRSDVFNFLVNPTKLLNR